MRYPVLLGADHLIFDGGGGGGGVSRIQKKNIDRALELKKKYRATISGGKKISSETWCDSLV